MDLAQAGSEPHQDPAELVRARLAALSADEERLTRELASKRAERKRYEVALSALTGESASARCVTRQIVRDELVDVLAASPEKAVSQKVLDSELRTRLKSRGLKLIGFSRRLTEVLGTEAFAVDRGKVRLLAAADQERGDGVA